MEYKVKGIIVNLDGKIRKIQVENSFNIYFSKYSVFARKFKPRIKDKVEIIIRKVK